MQREGCRHYITHIAPNLLDGNISLSHGFVPSEAPLTSLPNDYAIWDDLVSHVPELFYSNHSVRLLEEMKVLDTEKLEDRYLPRAALVLSILASAYWRHGIENYFLLRNTIEDATLPESLSVPWKEVCFRLGRGNNPYQNGTDLFMNNFQLKQPKSHLELNDIHIENLDVLVPSFRNEAERVFYMSFVDIHARTATLVGKICEIEEAIYGEESEKAGKVSSLLDDIARSIKTATHSLMKISPMKQTKTYCDNVLWAKTVGIFALPPSNFIQGGTSGTSIPLLHTLDALFCRRKFESHYGEYVKKHGYDLLDATTKGFVQKVADIGLRDWILSFGQTDSQSIKLVDAYNNLIDTYAGRLGFLDKHVSKVFNYLGVATMVGRNQSTSGQERYVRNETWKHVSADLKIARRERERIRFVPEAENKPPTHFLYYEDEVVYPTFTPKILARHYHFDDAWICLHKQVYNVTSFIKNHPGGSDILSAYLGRDSTKEFEVVNAHGKDHVIKLLHKFKIGNLVVDENDHHFIEHEEGINYLQKVFAILCMQVNRGNNHRLCVIFHWQAHMAFLGEHMPTLLKAFEKLLAPEPITLPKPAPDIDFDAISEARLEAMYQLSLRYIKHDIDFVERLLKILLQDEINDKHLQQEIHAYLVEANGRYN